MRKNTLTAIFGALAIISVVPAARAEIASRAYVDDKLETKMDAVTIDATPTAGSTNLVTSGGVASAIANTGAVTYEYLDDTLHRYVYDDLNIEYHPLLVSETDPDTGLRTIAPLGSHGIDSNYIAENAIAMQSINLPTMPTECIAAGGSCVLVAKGIDGKKGHVKFVWENIGRDTNETVPTSGEVNRDDFDTTQLLGAEP